MSKHTCPPDHAHGAKITCYTMHKCRCGDCGAANIAYKLDRRKKIAYGRWDTGRVDPGKAREHIGRLHSWGLSYDRIVELSGVSMLTVRHILDGRGPAGARRPVRISRESEAKILAVVPGPDDVSPLTMVSARGARRRIEALGARGWSRPVLAEKLGTGRNNLRNTIRAEQVTKRMHDKIAALYDDLWDQEPPRETPEQRIAVTRSLVQARRRGWLPPLTWDDIDHDDAPPCRPLDQIAAEFKQRAGRTSEHGDLVAEAAEQGLSYSAIAEAFGIGHTTARIAHDQYLETQESIYEAREAA